MGSEGTALVVIAHESAVWWRHAHLSTRPARTPDAISLSNCYLQRVQQPSARMLSKMSVVAQLGVLPPPLEAAPDANQRLSNKRCRNSRLVVAGYAFCYRSFRPSFVALLSGPGGERGKMCLLVELVTHAPEQVRIRIFCDDLVELRLQIASETDIIKQNILHAPHATFLDKPIIN